jgi:hypothetical protein
MKIFTHVSPDLDAATSVWAAQWFVPGANKAAIIFVPANWDGTGMEKGDIAVDIEAGGKGTKGEVEANGKTHSSFASIIKQFAPQNDQTILKYLVAFIDAGDSTGNAIKVLAPNTTTVEQKSLYSTSLGMVFAAIKYNCRGNDHALVERWATILDGILNIGRNRQEAFPRACRIPVIDGVAITFNERGAVATILFEECGARAIVYVDGNSIGVTRHLDETVRMDHPTIRAAVMETNEIDEWYAHPYGFLFCRGARKSPVKTPSKVKPENLANAIRRALAEENTRK